jgi:general secretion pathway protein E
MSDQTDRKAGRHRAELEAAQQTAERYGLDFLAEVPPESLDPALVARIPVDWARSHGVIPVRHGGVIGVLTADPGRAGVLDDVARILDADVIPVVAPATVIAACIERCYSRKTGTSGALLADMHEAAGEGPATEAGAEDLLQSSAHAPITRLANAILLEAARARASDIHFEPYESSLRVRFRVDGVLFDQTTVPKSMEQALVSRLKVMGRMDIAERRLPQDGMARAKVGDRKIDIRVSTIPVAEGERVVLRLLDRDSSLIPLADLGMPDDVRGEFESMLGEAHGLLICSGPTGSGKTTTLYAALRKLDTARMNIMTIEDPIEYRVPEINQMQVKPKIGLTFASGLRHLLRQDPDVVLVGETRDLETAEIAVRASLTGHLVFTTLHTNDAPGSVLRLMDMGVEPYLVASALRGVLAQRLIRVLCPQCRIEVTADTRSLAFDGPEADALRSRRVLPAPAGCPACRDGYKGRLGLFELMAVRGTLAEEIRRGCGDVNRLRALAEEHGMRTLMRDGLAKVLAGQTTLDEVWRSVGHLS